MEDVNPICDYAAGDGDGTLVCGYRDCSNPVVADAPYTLDDDGAWTAYVGTCAEHREQFNVFFYRLWGPDIPLALCCGRESPHTHLPDGTLLRGYWPWDRGGSKSS